MWGVWTGSSWLRIGTGGGNEPSSSLNVGNLLTGCKPVSFSRRTLLHGVSKYLH